MASTSSQTVKEYNVRVPRGSRKKYHMMRFHASCGADFKAWTSSKMERENNLREYKNIEDDLPKYGAGSEFGREQREEARRKRYGISVKKYKPEDQPWLLTVGGKPEKKYKGIREGGVSDNVAWYVFMQAKDGAFEAYPVEEWYNFQPIHRYKSLSAEEAEKEFERRDKIMNYFSVMYQKKLKKEDEEVEEGGKKKGAAAKSLQLSEIDDWMSDRESDGDDDDDEENEREKDSDEERSKGKDKNKKKGKKNQGGKKVRRLDGGSDDDCEEESDDYDEGAEHDYLSSDSSDPDQENDEVTRQDLAGVDEGLRKLLNSDEEDEDEEKKKEQGEEEKPEDEAENAERKKKNKKKKREHKEEDSSDITSDSSEDETDKPLDQKQNGTEKKAVNMLKRKMKDNPHGINPSKRPRSELSSGAGSSGSSDTVQEGSIRRYLMRKPMTTTELLQKFKSKKTGLSSEQLVQTIAQILKRINPVKHMIKGKMYLSIKSTL